MRVTTDIEWSDTEEVPANEYWIRLEQSPINDNKYWIHSQSTVLHRYLLFTPALSSLNGWNEYPHEIPLSAIIESEIITSDGPWHHIHCISVHNLAAISTCPRIRDPALQLSDHKLDAEVGSFQLFERNMEGDVIEWYLTYDSMTIMHHFWCIGNKNIDAELLVDISNA